MPDGVSSTVARWFGPADGPLLGWVTQPSSGIGRSGVLMLPPIGYQYWSSHRTLRVLAEQLANGGQTVVRIDYEGTGDSSGDQWAPERLAAWRTSAQWGADEVRELGCEQLVVVGARLGATIGLLDGEKLGAEGVVAWAPVLSGRRYAREVRLLSEDLPVPADRASGGDAVTGIVLAGVIFRAETLDDLATIALDRLHSAPAPRVLFVEGAEPGAMAVADRMRGLGATVDQLVLTAAKDVMDHPAEYVTVPGALVEAICTWIGPAP